MKHSVEEYL